MLVLSRRPNEDILFPNIGIRLRVLQVKGTVAKIGIEGPPEVQVLRAELAATDADKRMAPRTGSPSHALRNRLNKVTLGLHRFQQQWQAGLESEAKGTFQDVLDVLEALDRDWAMIANPPSAAPPSKPARRRTLLVEDDANERELLAGMLGMNGCECETAADGQDALDYLASHEPPDLVLLDMGLPRVSGPQMLERIRQEPHCRNLKVFAISGSNPTDLGVRVGEGGVDAWFPKPVNPRRLWEAIQQGLGPGAGAN